MNFYTDVIFVLILLGVFCYYLRKQQEEDELEQKYSSLSSSSDQQRYLHKEKHDQSKDYSSMSSSSDQERSLHEKHEQSKDSFSSWSPSKPCQRFSLAEIKLATRDFNDELVIGKGGFGNVYKGRIEFGGEEIDVAVKRLNLDSNQGATEFRAEIEMLSQFRHSHIVSLLGYHEHEGSDKREMMLVYEYMSNGSLEDHLHKRRANVLTWVQRLDICIGAARGLDYLHTGTSVQSRVIHRDVKSSNILLDGDFAAKISDFGLSKIGPANKSGTTKVYTDLIKGTFGYIDAEYFATHRLTRKSDVYAFGVVLLEVLCGRPALDFTLDEEQQSLSVWARDCIREGNIDRIIDPCLRGQTTAKCLNKFGQIAYDCILTSSKDRPTVTKVAARLESLLAFGSQKHGGVTIAEKVRALLSINITKKDSKITNKDSKITNKDYGRFIYSQFISVEELAFLKNHDEVSSLQIIGKGGRGEVYKYELLEPEGSGEVKTIAIKKILWTPNHAKKLAEEDIEVMRQIKSEIQTMDNCRHRNLLPLLAHVSRPNCYYLIHKFMKNGSLQDILQQVKEGSRELDWLARHRVALGVAAGLEYLHMGINPRIVHRDLKPANVLLDDDMEAKIADFGFAETIPDDDTHMTGSNIVGTVGYIAPEYYQTMKFTEKSDIYSFGVLLAVLVIGKFPLDEFFQGTLEMSLVKWMRNVMTSEDPKQAVDPKLMGNGYEEQMLLVLKIACLCTLDNPKERPSSRDARLMLVQINH